MHLGDDVLDRMFEFFANESMLYVADSGPNKDDSGHWLGPMEPKFGKNGLREGKRNRADPHKGAKATKPKRKKGPKPPKKANKVSNCFLQFFSSFCYSSKRLGVACLPTACFS